ncbi:MAG: type I DNA topoisomerase [Clostridia bacterium]|nr:type I DNA topoisomerase [Clostridia bacterium]
MSNLVIIESPGKTKALENYLGKGYKVVASIGHVRDLPKSALGVDIENGFAAKYVNIREKTDLCTMLRNEARKADVVYLATDPDREGEAISWHLLSVIDVPESKIRRVTFNEITKNAVKAGMASPRGIDMDLVNSQQTRRILDRIVGYKLSPFLWRTIRSGLSAGRVQSVAARIVVDRENEIRSFVPEEYWKIEATLKTGDGKSFTAHYFGRNGEKEDLHDSEAAQRVYDATVNSPFTVSSVKKSTKTRSPQPPFTTSTMLQDASRKLNFQSSKTMKVAQELYEGVDLGPERGGSQGLITYMRTDSVRISDEAVAAVRALIGREYGDKYLPGKPRTFRTKASAQDAHEAIRPSHVENRPDDIRGYLSTDQYKLYKLIWERFVACQMEAATFDVVNAVIDSAGYEYHASGSTPKFRGYLALYEESTDAAKEKEEKLPPLSKGDALTLIKLSPEQKFTEPPPRYTEASLMKYLEEQGIGRPSTITPTITTIISRGYVSREGKTLAATELGELTVALMKDNFPDIIDIRFTAGMENKLDDIASGKATMEKVLGGFWVTFSEDLKKAEQKAGEHKGEYAEHTDIVCEKCGAKMIVKSGRFGKFAACPNYPECKNTVKLDKEGRPVAKREKQEPEKTDIICDKCGGAMVLRHGRFGDFYSCSNFPRCRNTKPVESTADAVCPDCGRPVVKKYSKKGQFYACTGYPECKFSTSCKPSDKKCPACGKNMFEKKNGALMCLYKECPSNKGKG